MQRQKDYVHKRFNTFVKTYVIDIINYYRSSILEKYLVILLKILNWPTVKKLFKYKHKYSISKVFKILEQNRPAGKVLKILFLV